MHRLVPPGILAIGTLLIVATTAQSGEMIAGPVKATLVSCYDGDTCHFDVRIWPGLTVHTAVRLRGVDTPEIRGQCDSEKTAAIVARDFIAERLITASVVRLTNIEPDKYGGRVIADITIDDTSAATLLLADGLARPYDGGARGSWCADLTQR